MAAVLGAAPAARGQESSNLAVATFGKLSVTVADVNRGVAVSLKGLKVSPESLRLLQAEVLSQLITRKLMLAYFEANGFLPSEQEVDAAVDNIERQVVSQGNSLDEKLAESGSTRADLRVDIAISLATRKLFAAQVTDEVLAKYFDEHRQQFDGTLLHLAHIVWRVDTNDPAAKARGMAQAAAAREQIAGGKLTFEEAAAKYSAGPSRRHGGDMGFVPREGELNEDFAKVAFDLKQGDLSEPVSSNVGVHLIKCLEAKAGNKAWQDVRDELSTICSQELFEKVAAEELAKAKIIYSGLMPYFEPGTKNLVLPK